jgi:two-component system, LytTR family, sensor kinase
MKKVFIANDQLLRSQYVGATTLQSDVNQHWFIRYKVYHIFFWVVYHYFWTVFNVGKPLEVLRFIFSTPKFIFYVIFQAIAVYFNLYYLIPKFLAKGRYVLYLVYLAMTTIIAASIIVTGYYLTAYMKGTTLLALYGNGDFFHYFTTYTFPSTVTSMFLAMSIKLTKAWIQSRQREQLLEKEKLETELKFLRSQLNPHFLFNTINSIFVLIHKNPDQASEALAKFSDLLRYQLYECNEAEIPLSQELDYLDNYIELERLRQDSKTVKLTIALDKPLTYDYTIAPFILIPFVENAFKHVSVEKEKINWINITLSFSDGLMEFIVVNSVLNDQEISRDVMRNGGIGLVNVQRRLNLIYPHDHSLNITHEHERFGVKLNVNLHKQIAHERLTTAAVI